MTTYSAVLNSEIAVGAPITNNLMTKLRDNPLSIQEGDGTAPKIQNAALAGLPWQTAQIGDGQITPAKFASTVLGIGDTLFSGTASGNTTSLTAIPSGYKTLVFRGYGYYSNDNGHPWNFRIGDGGYETSYTTIAYESPSTLSGPASTSYIGPDYVTDTEWATDNDSSANTFEFELIVYNNGATNYKPYRARGWMRNALSTTLVEIRGMVAQAGEIDQIQIRCGTSGAATIVAGNYSLEGYK